MRLLLTLVFFLLYISNAMSQFSPTRELMIFGDSDNSLILQQLELLEKNNDELKERDIAITRIEKGDAFYEIYKIDSDAEIAVLLFGKDKGIKFRSQQLVSTEELFSIIDAMPMRQAEMRRQQKSNKFIK